MPAATPLKPKQALKSWHLVSVCAVAVFLGCAVRPSVVDKGLRCTPAWNSFQDWCSQTCPSLFSKAPQVAQVRDYERQHCCSRHELGRCPCCIASTFPLLAANCKNGRCCPSTVLQVTPVVGPCRTAKKRNLALASASSLAPFWTVVSTLALPSIQLLSCTCPVSRISPPAVC